MENLLPNSIIVSQAHSDSLESKKRQAERLLCSFAIRKGFGDPVTVSHQSTTLLLNLLFEYSGLNQGNSEKYKGVFAVNGIIIGLKWVYHKHGHSTAWNVCKKKDGTYEATGNPLEGNILISEFRKMYARKLSSIGRITRSADPITAEHIIEHGKKFLIGKISDPRDVLLHAFLLCGMNCGMRFDELCKVRFSSLKCTKYGVTFSISERTKNQCKNREYTLRMWPGLKFSDSILMDPLFAVSAWVLMRGDCPGFLFCDIQGDTHLKFCHDVPWTRKKFQDWMRSRLQCIGIPSEDTEFLTGHSLKRGGVQLLRMLGLKDKSIMTWFGMTGEGAYLRYTEICNNTKILEPPDFASSTAQKEHSDARTSREKVIQEIHYTDVMDWLDSDNL